MTKDERVRVKTYYNREQYSSSNISKNTPGLPTNVVDVFNPIRDITKSVINLVANDLVTTNDNLKEIWNINQMTTFSKKIIKEMYLEEEVFVEAIITPLDEIFYILHSVDNVEYTEVFGKIVRFKVNGTEQYYDENGELQEREYSREYIKLDNGLVKRVETIGDEIVESAFLLDKIPAVKFKNDSNLIEALNIIDKINMTEFFINQIFKIHGSPVIHAKNIKKFADENSKDSTIKKNAEYLANANFNSKAIINTFDIDQRDAEFKYIELTNPLIGEMQNDITRLEKRLNNLFPEFLLVESTTQNVSEETFLLKNNGLRSKIASIRADFFKSLVELDNIALSLNGKSDVVSEVDYLFFDNFKEQEKATRLSTISTLLDVISKAKEIDEEYNLKDIVDKMTSEALEQIKDMYI